MEGSVSQAIPIPSRGSLSAAKAALSGALGRRLESVHVHHLASYAECFDDDSNVLGEVLDGVGLGFDGGIELGFHWTKRPAESAALDRDLAFALACLESASPDAIWSAGAAVSQDASGAPDVRPFVGTYLTQVRIFGWAGTPQAVVLKLDGRELGVALGSNCGTLGDCDDVQLLAAHEVLRVEQPGEWLELARLECHQDAPPGSRSLSS